MQAMACGLGEAGVVTPKSNNSALVLVIDSGNTLIKLACFRHGELVAFTTCDTKAAATASGVSDVLKKAISTVQEKAKGKSKESDAFTFAVVGTVVPALSDTLKATLSGFIDASHLLWIDQPAVSGLNTGELDVSAYQGGHLGVDRLADSLAAIQQFPEKRLLVVDAGTTCTFDVVDENGVHKGGAIAPGPRRFQQLVGSDYAAQLFEVDLYQKPATCPGLTTEDSLKVGLNSGYKGMMVEIITQLLYQCRWSSSQVQIVFTGGESDALKQLLVLEFPTVKVASHLTVEGLLTLKNLNS